MRERCICLIVLVCLVGCRGRPEVDPELIVDDVESYLRLCENGPPRPFASLLRVVERDGRMVWRKSGEPFTGTLVRYRGGPRLRAYLRGYAPEYLLVPAPYDHPSSIVGEVWQEAFRYHIARNAPGHNEYIFLIGDGRESDIPMLLASLRSFRKRADGAMICSQLHCVAALRAITGANPGNHYSDWASWWRRKYGTEVPEWKPLDEERGTRP